MDTAIIRQSHIYIVSTERFKTHRLHRSQYHHIWCGRRPDASARPQFESEGWYIGRAAVAILNIPEATTAVVAHAYRISRRARSSRVGPSTRTATATVDVYASPHTLQH